ncbi:MAG: hypothetical protein MHPSP_004203, partial [Paramarteilia canceri]
RRCQPDLADTDDVTPCLNTSPYSLPLDECLDPALAPREDANGSEDAAYSQEEAEDSFGSSNGPYLGLKNADNATLTPSEEDYEDRDLRQYSESELFKDNEKFSFCNCYCFPN